MVSPKHQASIKESQFAFCSTGQKGSWAAFKGLNPWSFHPALPDKEKPCSNTYSLCGYRFWTNTRLRATWSTIWSKVPAQKA